MVSRPEVETTSRAGLLVGLAVGVPTMAYGARGALDDRGDAQPGDLARWMLGAALVHDLVVVPIALGVGFLAWRARRACTPAAPGAFLVSMSLVFVAGPYLRGYGRSAAVPSLLPRNYATGLAVYLAVIWTATAATVIVTRMRRHRR